MPLDLLVPDPLDEAGEIGLPVARDPHLGVEIDDRDIDGVRQRVQKLHRRRARERHVVLHALAEIEQQPEVQRRAVRGGPAGVAAGKVGDGLGTAVLGHLEIVRGEAQNRLPLAVGDRDGHRHQVHGPAKDRRLLPEGRRPGRDKRQKRPETRACARPHHRSHRLHCTLDGGRAAERRQLNEAYNAGLAMLMRCLAVCQDELVIRMLDEILLPGFDVEFIVENRPLARRLHEAGVNVIAGDPRRTDTFLKADIGPGTCVIIEDNGRRNPRRILQAVTDAGGTLVYVLGVGTSGTQKRADECRSDFPDVSYLAMSELFGGALLTEFGRSLTKARVQQYQRYFSDADRVLIMLHNDPDPDAMASGLALRNLLHRTKATAIIGAIQGVTRPGKPAHGQPARHPRRAGHPVDVQRLRSHRHGGRPAALLRRLDRPGRSGDRSPSRAAGLHGGLQGHPGRLRIDVHDPDRAPAGGRREHLGAHRDGDALRHQVRHAVLQPADEPCGPRRVLVPLPARGRGHDPEDGRR